MEASRAPASSRIGYPRRFHVLLRLPWLLGLIICSPYDTKKSLLLRVNVDVEISTESQLRLVPDGPRPG